MKRSEIAVGQVLFLADSTKWDDPDHYGFNRGGQVAVVMDAEAYHLRAVDDWSRHSEKPFRHPGGRGVLVVVLGENHNYETDEDGKYIAKPGGGYQRCWNHATEKVVSIAHLRGDWYDITTAQDARLVAKQAREDAWKDDAETKKARRQACVASLRALGYPADSEKNYADGVVMMAPEYAEAIIAELTRFRAIEAERARWGGEPYIVNP